MIIPIRTDYRMARTPWVNYALLAANVLLYFLGYNAASAEASERIGPWLLHPDAPQIYQFFSSVFLHASFMHLLGNMLFLWVFGNAVNDRFGSLGYLTFYITGGILAGVGYILLEGSAPVLGASGAISAVTGAYLVLLPRARVTVLALLIYVFMPFEVSSLFFLLFQFVTNLWMSLSPALSGRSAGGVAYVAHSSGYVFGIGVAVLLLAVKALPRDPFDMLNLLRTFRRRRTYKQVVAGGYDPYSFVRPDLRQGGKYVDATATQSAVPPTIQAREFQLRQDISDDLSHADLSGAAAKYRQLVQLADEAVLPRQQQLDIANYLMSSEQYPVAADAYERFLRRYSGSYEHIPDIYLMLGLLYGRYLHQYDRAKHYLQLAIEKLHDPGKVAMAQGDLEQVKKFLRP